MDLSEPGDTTFARGITAWQAEEPHALRDILPNYEVLSFLGRGGMGAVYKARQVSLDRIVALKLVPPHAGGALDFAARFKVEARAMARLSHPNIVAVHDSGEAEDGHLFYAMEFVDGTDLARHLATNGRLPPAEALRIALAVCDALKAAHAEGVVHRDIKPSNILLGASGSVKVADFGLAKMDDPTTASLTLSTTSMGSQGYAAPEVFSKARDADQRADIYSLGVVLYEMLTGDVPRGMFKLPTEKVTDLDPRLDAIICKALEEEREERFQSVAELGRELEAAASPAGLMLAAGTLPEKRVTERGLAKPVPQVLRRISWGRVALFTLALGTLAWAAARWMRSDETATGRAAASPPSQSQWQNILKGDGGVLRQSLQGNWMSIHGSVQGPPDSASQPALCGLSWNETGSCDLHFRITKTTGDDGIVHFGFRHGDSAGGIILSDQRTSHGVSFVGITTLHGVNAEKDSPWVRRQNMSFLPVGQERKIRLLLRDEGVAVWLDGIEVYRWKGDWKQLSQSPPLYLASLTRGPVFAIGSHRARIAIHSAEAWPVTGEEARTLPEVPPAEFRGHRYQYIAGAFTWAEAEANAASLGGHLVTLTSAEENHWVWKQFSPHLRWEGKPPLRNRGWWIGGKPLESGDGWQWTTGEPFGYACWSLEKPPPARTPRLRQHDNGGGLTAWTPVHYSERCGFVVEWDDAAPAVSQESDTRQFVAWVLSLPLFTEPSHLQHRVPDVLVEGGTRNLRKASELPTGPFTLSRIRLGPLPMDARPGRSR